MSRHALERTFFSPVREIGLEACKGPPFHVGSESLAVARFQPFDAQSFVSRLLGTSLG